MIYTHTRRYVNPLDVPVEQIDIRDIAHHLSLINRFNGATRRPISVAFHSLWVANLVPDRFKLQALLHDGSEAYIGDITKWLKQTETFEGYRAVEKVLQSRVFQRFGVILDEPDKEMDDIVRAADKMMVRIEAWWSWGEEMPLFTRQDYPVPSEQELLPIMGTSRSKGWGADDQLFALPTIIEHKFLDAFREYGGVN